MGFKDEMSGFDEEWNEAQEKPPRFGGPVLPDGPHQVIITAARLEEQKERWVWMITFQNTDGRVTKWQNLDNDVGRSIAAQDAKTLGYVGPMSGLEEACESEMFLGLVCDIRVKTRAGDSRDFTDVYINRKHDEKGDLESFAPAAAADDAAAASDDDIPF